jgi:hypothetical protein
MSTDQHCYICYEQFSKTDQRYSKITCERCNSNICAQCLVYSIRDSNDSLKCFSCNISFTLYEISKYLNQDIIKERILPSLYELSTKKEISKKEKIIQRLEQENEIDFENKVINLQYKINDGIHGRRMKYFIDKTNYDIQKLNSLYENKKDVFGVKTSEDVHVNPIKLESIQLPVVQKKSHTKCYDAECYGRVVNGVCQKCGKYFCFKCFERVDNLESHICAIDKVESIQVISNEARPCPNCNISITKTAGCNQMYCTYCKTKFNYSTLKIIPNGQHFDNPHLVNSKETDEMSRLVDIKLYKGKHNSTIFENIRNEYYSSTNKLQEIPNKKLMIRKSYIPNVINGSNNNVEKHYESMFQLRLDKECYMIIRKYCIEQISQNYTKYKSNKITSYEIQDLENSISVINKIKMIYKLHSD